MTNGDLYNLALTILRKESRGNIIKPDRFTYLLKLCHHEYYNQQIEKWDVSQTVHDSLRPFLVHNEVLTFALIVDGSAACTLTPGLPPAAPSKTYRNLVSAISNVNSKCDIVTPIEWVHRQDDDITGPSATHPIMMVGSSYLHILPSSVTGATVTYLREATSEPFFDYYIDAQRNIQYLTPAQVYNLDTSEVYRTGIVDGGAGDPVTAISIELEWADYDKMKILNMILEKLGVSLSDQGVAQYSMVKEQQQNTA